MALSVTNLFTPATQAQWQSTILGVCQTLGLNTTSWQSGGVGRTIISGLSYCLAGLDGIVSTIAQGGFLTTAAVVTTDPNTTPGAAPGWLDIVAQAGYNVIRIAATFASGAITLTNSTSNTYGPFAPGTYHIANPTSGATYSNVNSLTIGPGTTTGQQFQADIVGSGSTSAIGTITQTVTSLVGVTCTNPAQFTGANAESNSALVNRCQLKLQSLSPNGPSGAYSYFALTASQLLAALVPSVTLTGGPITRALVQTAIATGFVTTFVADGTGAVPGISQLAINNVTNNGSGLFRITTASSHGLSTGNFATITGVQGSGGITNANGTWVITQVNATNFDLQGSTFQGTYTTGGSVDGGDLGEVDSIIQQNAVPTAITAVTASATAFNVAIVATVYVPAAQVAAYTAAVSTALANYVAGLPIGGVQGTNNPNLFPLAQVEGVLYQAGAPSTGGASYVKQITGLTLNGSAADASYPFSTSVAVLSPAPVITVTGV